MDKSIDINHNKSDKEICDILGLKYNTYRSRRYRGWTREEALGIVPRQKEECTIVKKSSNCIYNNKIIHDIDELITEIKKLSNINKINLIDYENVCDNKLLIDNHLAEAGQINIFFFNACICSNNYYGLLKKNESINLQIVSLEAANQLVDHMLVFYLGALIGHFPTNNYTIFSKDSGYRAFISNLNYPNIKIANIDKPIKKQYKYSLAKYILENPDIVESKYFTKNEFRSLFTKFYNGKKFNSRSLGSLINELIKFEFIDMRDLGKDKYYRFCFKRISEYVEYKEKKLD